MSPKVDWKAKAAAKAAAIFDAIPDSWRIPEPIPTADAQRDITGPYLHKYLTGDEIEITETNAVGIVKKVADGEWHAETVVRAFCHRAALAHQYISCLHEVFFDAAIEDAVALDEYYRQHGKPIGPLHGLPVSLKDQMHVKGVETTMGYVGWIGTFQGKQGSGLEKQFESEIVTELRGLGAVLYCKTSVPQTLMSAETMNNIIGYTFNPKNRNLSSGGSSGGEGALISLRGSPIGLGTDYSGSIRMPAAFNGLYGIRPSSGRLPYQGMANSMDGQNTVLSVVGPMSHSPADLGLMLESILSRQPWLHDPAVVEMPWRPDIVQATEELVHSGQRLVFGMISCDGVVQPHPPILRALALVREALNSQGHGLMDWAPPSHKRAVDIVQTCWLYDGGADVHQSFGLSGEPIAEQIGRIYSSQAREQMSASAIARNNVAKRDYQKEYMEYWNSTSETSGTGRPVEAVIMPAGEAAATRQGCATYGGYATALSALDWTVITIPISTVDKNVDSVDSSFSPLSDFDTRVQQGYIPEIYDGAHVSLQLLGRRFQEEKLLVLADYIGRRSQPTSQPRVEKSKLSKVL
uniref:Amidase domain-containing protein n=1 Tax=Bionectria ochroleuca TaxID=29856 RepID=A0A8H7TRY5_BIOOC